MDYKEKYEQALKVASQWHKDGIGDVKTIVECIFPELKESEDEMIRKEIISFMTDSSNWYPKKETKASWISWLEKQGEKTEPIEGFNTEFEKQVSHLIASAINKEHEYNRGYVKWAANALLNYAKHEIEKQGEQPFEYDEKHIADIFEQVGLAKIVRELANDKLTDALQGAMIELSRKHYEQEPLFKKGDTVIWENEEYNILDVTKDSYNVGGYLIPIHRQNELLLKPKHVGYEWDADKKALNKIEKQGEQKPQGKSAFEVWKDMRLEVYQQASGNRHEPNYSDDSTKMFSLTDIDEIFEKVAEKQGEQKPTDKVEPKFKVGDKIVEDNEFGMVGGEITDIDNTHYELNDGGIYIPISHQDNYKLVEEQNHAWSEEDVINIQDIDSVLFYDKNLPEDTRIKLRNWLKSIKERMKGE